MTLVRNIRATPAVVFEALSTAEGLTHWWGPDDLPVLAAEADVRVGGRYSVRFRTRDGQEHECEGQFVEIVPRERLVLTFRWARGGEPREKNLVSRLAFHLKPIELGTELTLIHANLSDEISWRGHEAGWAGALEKFVRLFGSQR